MNGLTIISGAVLLLAASAASADTGDTTQTPLDPLDPVMIVSPLTIVQGDGVKIGEGTSVYPQVGFVTGFESNTFYQANDPVGAGTMELIVEAGIGSLSAKRLANYATDVDTVALPDFIYEADAYASYLQYLSSNGSVTDQGGLGLGAHGTFTVHPKQAVSFFANDDFNRILRSADFETRGNANRDINALALRLLIQPDGRSISGVITYTDTLDLFEDTALYSDRLLNVLDGRLNYTFLPLTTAYLDVSAGYDTGIGANNMKVSSSPVTANLGVSTALTVQSSLGAQAGYAQGFYATGPDYGSLIGAAYFEYRYGDLSRLRLMYDYTYQDSVNANFYHEHAIQGWLEQKFVPFAVYVSPQLRLREYAGVIDAPAGQPNRDDVIVAVALGLRYQFRNWITASAEYRFTDDSTSYRYIEGASMLDPSYMRHELFAGVRLAY